MNWHNGSVDAVSHACAAEAPCGFGGIVKAIAPSYAGFTVFKALKCHRKTCLADHRSKGAEIMVGFPELPRLDDDGLPIAEVGSYSEQKYRLVGVYASLFLTAMRAKWDSLVYLDLFAGSGYAQFKGTDHIVAASPLTVLELPEKFDRYIFCESKAENADALNTRCSRDYPDADVKVIPRDANDSVDEIIASMPNPGQRYTVLGFCFLDPFKMVDLQFATIEQLAKRYMDFLVLIPSGMEARRNEHKYINPDCTIMDQFVGNDSWRHRWQQEKMARKSFENFIVEEFGRSMRSLDYKDRGLEGTATILIEKKNVLLYRLAFYSTHDLGNKFWQDTKRYTDPQKGFPF